MTIEIIKDLRSLRVGVIHPRDNEGEELVRHLQRIGCQVQAMWPIPKEPPTDYDIVLLAVRQDMANSRNIPWTSEDGVPGLIAIIDYENPTILQAVVALGAKSVVARPIRAFGLLTNLIVARTLVLREQKLRQRLKKLEEKVLGQRKISKAKAIIMKNNNVSEEDAYRLLREQAMAKRVSLEDLAVAIINATDVLTLAPRPLRVLTARSEG